MTIDGPFLSLACRPRFFASSSAALGRRSGTGAGLSRLFMARVWILSRCFCNRVTTVDRFYEFPTMLWFNIRLLWYASSSFVLIRCEGLIMHYELTWNKQRFTYRQIDHYLSTNYCISNVFLYNFHVSVTASHVSIHVTEFESKLYQINTRGKKWNIFVDTSNLSFDEQCDKHQMNIEHECLLIQRDEKMNEKKNNTMLMCTNQHYDYTYHYPIM